MAKINIELANGQKAGETLKQLTHQAAALKKEVFGLKPGTEEFIKSAASLNQVEKKMGDVRSEVKSTVSASAALKQAWNQLPGAGFFNSIGSSLGSVKQGVGGLTSSMGVLKGAIAATGLGLLVLVIAGLVQWMMKVEAITNVVKGVWDGLTAAVQTFMKAVATLDFSDLGDKMKTAAKEGYNLVQVFDALEDKARAIDLATANSEKTVDKLLLQSKNVQLSFAERIALLDKATIFEKFNHDRKLRYAAEFLDAVNREVDNANRQGILNDELSDKQVDAKKALIEVERESIVLQEKIENRRSALEEKEVARIEKISALKQKERDQLKKQDGENTKFLQEQENLENKNNELLEETLAAKATAKAKKSMTAALTQLQQKNEAYKKDSENFRLVEEGKRAIEAETLATFNEGANSMIALLGATSEARKKNANTIKTLQTGQVVVNGIMEISEIAKTFAALGPIGQVLAAFRIAFSVARTAAAVQGIQAQKFERGGVFKGPSHAQGGIQVEVEGDELFMAKGVYRDPYLRNMASQINVAGGGRSFAAGGPTNPFDDTTVKAGSGADSFQSIARLEKSFTDYAKKIDNWASTLQVTNNLQSTRKGLQTLNKLERDANV